MSMKPALRTIVAGSRDDVSRNDLEIALDGLHWEVSVLLCGCARGADTIGREWAEENKVPIELYPANWERFGRRAGYRRNEEMSERAEALIALWNGISKGTAHMIQISNKKGLPIRVLNVKTGEMTNFIPPMFEFFI